MNAWTISISGVFGDQKCKIVKALTFWLSSSHRKPRLTKWKIVSRALTLSSVSWLQVLFWWSPLNHLVLQMTKCSESPFHICKENGKNSTCSGWCKKWKQVMHGSIHYHPWRNSKIAWFSPDHAKQCKNSVLEVAMIMPSIISGSCSCYTDIAF